MATERIVISIALIAACWGLTALAGVRAPLAELRNPLQSKRHFLAFGTPVVGVQFAVFSLWFIGRDGDVLQWAFLVALAFGAALLWCHVMWPYFHAMKERSSRR